MTISPSSTTAGKGGEGGGARGPRPSGAGVRQRKATGGSSSSSSAGARRTVATNNAGSMWRFYQEDSPGLKVGPVPVLVMSLIFIASVFVLHIWGKYTRG